MKNKARLTRISAILGAAFFLSVLSSAAPVAWFCTNPERKPTLEVGADPGLVHYGGSLLPIVG